MRARLPLSLAVMTAMLAGVAMLRPLSDDGGFFLYAALAVAGCCLVGTTGRALRLRAPTLLALQLTLGLVLFALLVTELGSRPLTTALPRVLAEAMEWIQVSAAPMGPSRSVAIMAAVGLWFLTAIADTLVVGAGLSALIMAPLLVTYAIPAVTLETPGGPTNFFWFAGAVGIVLLTDAWQRAGLLRSNGVRTPTQRRSLITGGLGTLLAGALGAAAVGGLPIIEDRGSWEPIGGNGPIQMSDPSLDMKRNLELPSDRTVITYVTDRPTGVNLRLAVLNGFDQTGWHLEQTQLFGGPLPAADGLRGGSPRRTTVTILGFQTQWLPLPYAPTGFDAAGDWRHEPATLGVLWAGDGTPPSARLSYNATSTDVPITGEALEQGQGGRPDDGGASLALPTDLPSWLPDLAREVTRGATTDGARALALQRWFRSGEFAYSLDPAPGAGYEAIERFLTADRAGYCEQFAGSMAAMARSLGIPARVAIGFLPGDRIGGTWQVSIRDMHAWPELYFEGLGWVAFEPTPSVAQAPGWARDPSASPSASAGASPTPTRSSAQPSASTSAAIPPGDAPTPPGGTEAGLPLLGILGSAAAAALLVAPLASRRRRRLGRLAEPDPARRAEAAWDEVRDTIRDSGGRWPGGTPRQIADAVAAGLDGRSAEALRGLAVWVERGRYDATPGPVPMLTAEVALITDALWERSGSRGGRGAVGRGLRRFFPRSLLPWRPGRGPRG